MVYTRVTAVWTGAAGLPGWSRFKFRGSLDLALAEQAAGRVRQFFQSIQTRIPVAISIAIEPAVQIFSEDQVLQGEFSIAPPPPVTGTSAAGYSAPVGVVVNWATLGVLAGRRVRGRTFIVPLSSEAYQTDGTPGPGTMGEITGAGDVLLSGTPPLVILGGPPAGPNGIFDVIACNVPDKAAVLRSRRD